MKENYSDKELKLEDLAEMEPTSNGLNANHKNGQSHHSKVSHPGFSRQVTEEKEATTAEGQLANQKVEGLLHDLLTQLGENPDRDGLKDTPQRVRRSLTFLTDGYGKDVHEVLGNAVFEESYDEVVLVRDIEMYSMCEHHMLPFYGKCHIAYIPNGKIVGLSKLPRIVDVFSRRLQVQERLTTQIAHALDDLLHPAGVAVVTEAYHLCMMMRGVQKQNSSTVASCMLGAFREDNKTRQEFLNLIHTTKNN